MKTRPPPVVLYLKTQCNLKYQINLFSNLKIIIVKKLFSMMMVITVIFASCQKTHLEYKEDVVKAKEGLTISQVVSANKLQEAVGIFNNDAATKNIDAETLSKDFQAAWSEFKLSIEEQKIAFNEVETAVNALFADLDTLHTTTMRDGGTNKKRQVNKTEIAKNNFVKDANAAKAVFAKFDKIIEEGQDLESAFISDAMLSSLSGHASKIHGIAQQSERLLKELEDFTKKTNSLLGSTETQIPAMAEVPVSAPVAESSTPPESIGSYVSRTERPSAK
jgi:hypothetical protein